MYKIMREILENFSVTWDIALFLALVAGSFFVAIANGNKRLKTAMLALYVLETMLLQIPNSWIESLIQQPLTIAMRAGIFAAFFSVVAFFLARILRNIESHKTLFSFLGLSVLFGGFFMYLLVSFLGTQALSPLSQKLFLSSYSSFWPIAAFAGLILF